MIKPVGIQRGMVGEIISRFERKGFKLVAMKMLQTSVKHLTGHLALDQITYLDNGPVCAMVWEGLNAVKTGRDMLDETNPGTIGNKICYGSDAVESANYEISLWFKPEELCDWTSAQKDSRSCTDQRCRAW